MLMVDADGRLSGILTDADIRRLLVAHRGRDILAEPVSAMMIRNPKRIRVGELASKAIAILNEYRIDELPVVDDGGPAGRGDRRTGPSGDQDGGQCPRLISGDSSFWFWTWTAC